MYVPFVSDVAKWVARRIATLYEDREKLRQAVSSAEAEALAHLYGVRDAPPGDSEMYRNEKQLLGVKLNKLIKTAGRSPQRFEKDLDVAHRVNDAVVIGGSRDIEPHIADLERVIYPNRSPTT
jgi:hypothetical protein